jgi:hypothetical protein
MGSKAISQKTGWLPMREKKMVLNVDHIEGAQN